MGRVSVARTVFNSFSVKAQIGVGVCLLNPIFRRKERRLERKKA